MILIVVSLSAVYAKCSLCLLSVLLSSVSRTRYRLDFVFFINAQAPQAANNASQASTCVFTKLAIERNEEFCGHNLGVPRFCAHGVCALQAVSFAYAKAWRYGRICTIGFQRRLSTSSVCRCTMTSTRGAVLSVGLSLNLHLRKSTEARESGKRLSSLSLKNVLEDKCDQESSKAYGSSFISFFAMIQEKK